MGEQQVSGSDSGEKQRHSFMGNKIGGAIVTLLSSVQNIGDGKPYVVDLKDSIQPAIDTLMKKPRSPDAIRADIKALEMELEMVLNENEKKDNVLNKLQNVGDDDQLDVSTKADHGSNASTTSISMGSGGNNECIIERPPAKEINVTTGSLCCW